MLNISNTTRKFPRMIYDTFVTSSAGTKISEQYVTSKNITVNAPGENKVRDHNGLTYVSIGGTKATIVLPCLTTSVRVGLVQGTAAKATVRFIDEYSLQRAIVIPSKITPGGVYYVEYSGAASVISIEVEWPMGVEAGLVDIIFVVDDMEETAAEDDATMASIETMASIDETTCSGIVFAETSILSGNTDDLNAARRFIAGVAYKRNGTGTAKPKIPSESDLANPITKAIWENCKTAAKSAANDDVGTCKHFVIWYSDDNGNTPSKFPKEIKDPWPYTQIDKIKQSWGPFKMPFPPIFTEFNEIAMQPLDLLNREINNIYVITYCGVA
ncbi:hypothetical protein NTGHW29_750012 [Candidatus Nitrotoga sp. HW29]|uniref:hypothetical protein n=1 Tax=Candidatus Nitrotoga sp. HW29 TaxID=2886963 RepID=UPI001EF18E71|nr:hypothetical protein [Candidatus Nitrotoga sp. HW29]CAH1906094.1 hypothetical protein NTGHW29_750012 [Candidatus Nitrotoga sp. HW29]